MSTAKTIDVVFDRSVINVTSLLSSRVEPRPTSWGNAIRTLSMLAGGPFGATTNQRWARECGRRAHLQCRSVPSPVRELSL